MHSITDKRVERIMKKNTKILILIVTAALLTTGVALAINGNLRLLSPNLDLVPDYSDLEESDRQMTYPFTFTQLPEYFEAGLILEGSGYAGQNHSISIWVEHSRPDSSVWLAAADYSLSIRNESYSEPIISNSFSGLRNTVPFEYSDHLWTSLSANGTYDFVFSLVNIVWTMLPEYTITSTAGAGGSIDPLGAITVLEGDDQTFTATAAAGYTFFSFLIDTIPIFSLGTHTFPDVQADHNIHANFIENIGFYSEVNTTLELGVGPLNGWTGTITSCAFNGETSLSIATGSDVTVMMVIQNDGDYTGYHFDYHFEAERVGGGDRHMINDLMQAGPITASNVLSPSTTFPAESGDWVIILVMDAMYLP